MAHIVRLIVTIMNPTEDEYERMTAMCSIARDAVAANEVCQTTCTPRIQAYVALTRAGKKRQAGWKKLLPRAH